MTFSHGLKFKMTDKISLSTNMCTCNKWHENLYVFHWCDYYLTHIVYKQMDKWYRQLCLCSKGLQLMWIWWGVQGGCVSGGVLSLQMLWTCIIIFKNSFLDIWVDIPLTNLVTGVLISTDDRWNAPATLFKEVGYFFPPKKKQLVWIMPWAKIESVHAEIYVIYSIIIICSLLAGIDCVANKSKFD